MMEKYIIQLKLMEKMITKLKMVGQSLEITWGDWLNQVQKTGNEVPVPGNHMEEMIRMNLLNRVTGKETVQWGSKFFKGKE